jgi:starch synthase
LITDKQKVWIFTFEYAGIVKVGGLGEVPANQAKNLTDKFDITVFIPSHGQIERLKKTTELEKLPFNSVGLLDPFQIGINELESSYNISFYRCKINNVEIILISGENAFTSKFLDDKIVYNPETILGKICLYSIGLRSYIEYLIDHQKEKLPDIVHMHDYHVVIPFIGMKQILTKYGLDVNSIITLHLLTWPRQQIEFYKVCGIDDTPFSVILRDGHKTLTLGEIFTLCEDPRGPDEDYYPPTVEKIGAIVSDLVTTVSKSYLETDVIPNLGGNLIEFKTDFIWDGCDWEYDDIFQAVLRNNESEIRTTLNISSDIDITRAHMKEYLLTYKMSHLSQSPLINSTKILDAINEISNGNPFIKNGNIKAFIESGPLVIATGRISRQKGFENIFKAIPGILGVIPNAKFLLLILPTDYSLSEIKTYAEYVKQYPENLRIIFGVAANIFQLAHIAADVYCALSRWEPFGIIALEAMAVKLPIIATKVGGLQESIIDIRTDPEFGTGILIEKDDISQFASALISLFRLVEIKEKVKGTGSLYEAETLQLVNSIPDEIIKSRALLDANYIDKIRENSYNRVKFNFRWNIVSKKLVDLYKRISNN